VAVTKEDITGALSEVYDPEIPFVNVVDLGLIYDMRIDDGNVDIDMTLTAPGCPMAGMIASLVKEAVVGVEGVEEANVNVVWDPPWDPSRMTEEGKKKLGFD
jgi:metal-sulfur cluster biosynthetic enzyme